MYLIAYTIKHVLLCNAVGTIVVPKWKSAIFWPLIVCPTSGKFIELVTDFVEYDFVKDSAENSVFTKGKLVLTYLF